MAGMLPAYRFPTNALLKMDGLGDALADIGKVRRGLEQRDYNRQQDTIAQATAADERQYQRGMDSKNLALRRQQVQNALMPKKPAGVQEYEYAKGQGFEGSYLDYQRATQGGGGDKIVNANGRVLRVTPDGVSELYAPPPSAADRMIDNLLARRGGQQPSPTDQPSQAPMPGQQPEAPATLQPQSFNQRQPMPGVVLTAGGKQPQPGAQPQPQPSDDMVDTPYGRMSRDEARQLGGAMLLDPKTAAAGKVILDASQPAGAALTEPTANEIDKQQFNSVQALARLKDIEQQTNPDFLTIEGKAGLRITEFLNSFRSGQKLVTPEDRQQLEKFQSWRASSWDNANRYIKEITGAQMSEAEAARLLRAMPNPGTGVFDGDDPASFGAKMKNVTKTMRLSIARYNYLRKNGFNGDANAASSQLPLHQMEGVIQRKANELQNQIYKANPNIPKQDAKRVIRQQLRAEFGMDV